MKSVPKKGERVAWNSSQGMIEGQVIKTVTSSTSVRGRTAKATKSDPQVLVKSAKTGQKALHRPAALKKV